LIEFTLATGRAERRGGKKSNVRQYSNTCKIPICYDWAEFKHQEPGHTQGLNYDELSILY
jgi:hypothetical protein